MKRLGLIAAALVLSSSPGQAQPNEPTVRTQRIDCPASTGRGTRCVSGQDENGAWFVAAVPANWNRRLIVHSHC